MFAPEEIRRRLKDSNYRAVSKNSGVGYHVICRFMHGADEKFSVIEKLSAYLENKENGK